MAQNNITLYLLDYSNYYDRKVKRHDTVAEYMPYNVFEGPVCNFNPADGIDTEHVFNIATLQNPPPANYVIAVDENSNIVSRWFITNSTRIRGGQYKIALHRDLVADFYTTVINAPTYIERAMLSTGNPLIYNTEGMRFNQIKKKEVLLKDKTNTPWIVGYLATNYAEAEGADAGNISSTYVAENTIYPELSWKEYRIIHTIYTGGKNQTLITRLRNTTDGKIFDIDQNQVFSFVDTPDAATNFFAHTSEYDTTPINSFMADYYAAPKFSVDLSIAGFTNTAPYIEDVSKLLALNGQKVKNTDYVAGQESTNGPEYFYVSIVPQGIRTLTTYLPVASTEYNRAKAFIQGLYQNSNYGEYFEFRNYSANGNTFAIKFTVMEYKFGFSNSGLPTTVKTSFLDLQDREQRALVDAPYVMFATPYYDINYINAAGQEKSHLGDAARNLSAEIIKRFSGGYAYDLQLLSYCPMPELINENGKFDMTGLSNTCYSTIFAGENEVGFFVFPDKSSFSTVITLDEKYNLPSSAIDTKIDIETKFCRLVSPNYAGAFDFTPAKNGGLSFFEVNATYKPYQPYIHINPNFNAGYLYGGDYNDNRGLVCGGDFSLPQTSDAWISYQSQNKSYRESFDRQVENMETTYNIQYKQMRTAGIINAVTAGLSGATAGAMAGSLAGIRTGIGTGIAAGLAGGIASGVGLSADLKAAEALQKEALSYSQAQFDMSLQNIQALPTTMSRTSSFDINNKLYPFVEYYEATQEEMNALRNKITYRGMTVNIIDKISNFIQQEPSFIQGSVIRFDSLNEDYHLAAALANEIHKGVYI